MLKNAYGLNQMPFFKKKHASDKAAKTQVQSALALCQRSYEAGRLFLIKTNRWETFPLLRRNDEEVQGESAKILPIVSRQIHKAAELNA